MKADLRKKYRQWMSLLRNCTEVGSVIKVILACRPQTLVLAFPSYKLGISYLAKTYLMKIKKIIYLKMFQLTINGCVNISHVPIYITAG